MTQTDEYCYLWTDSFKTRNIEIFVVDDSEMFVEMSKIERSGYKMVIEYATFSTIS